MNDDMPTFELSHQAQRELLLASWLDISDTRFREVLQTFNERELDLMGGTAVEQYIVQLCSDHEGQMLAQAIAAMSDQTLHEAVRRFGVDPLPDITY